MKDQGASPGSASSTQVDLEPVSREVNQDLSRVAGNTQGLGFKGHYGGVEEERQIPHPCPPTALLLRYLDQGSGRKAALG